jgi:hypothetical protein
MSQIKLGFDRIPVPSVKGFEPLYDILKGVPLIDANGNLIVTEQEGPVQSLANAKNATSVFINNDYLRSLPIQEQFAESSEVSTTLLGIPRAEVQLSLFSDVSTYGLNPEEFEFYSWNGVLGRPSGWYTRRNDTFGDHFYSSLKEETNEQALVLQAYPVPYTFPFGPRWAGNGYNEIAYERFVKFVQLGNQLYEDYKTSYLDFATQHFLNPSLVTYDTQEQEVVYNVSEDEGYDLLEKWTMTWMDMRDQLLEDPASPGNPLSFLDGYGADDTRPGYSSTSRYFGLLQSRKAYRYQPGRISGFTFGFRCSTDEASVDNIIEWGIGNPTDQYVYQVRGASFSIVRRSTVPLPDVVIESLGLRPEDQRYVTSDEPTSDSEFYELVIPRDFFNGDSLDGNGPSGYLLDPRKVTMYKIEFGWYGAIGAKFYAYIPTSYGDARWVLIHTLIIENKLNEPCLEDPYFKFRYTLNIRDTSNLRAPQYLYKYGASCYIDGGDNTAGRIYSYSSDDNSINNAAETPLLGIYPKQYIQNTRGYEKPNKRNVYPSTLKITADQLTQIKMVEVDGCPAFGHHYAPSLHANTIGTIREIESISADGKSITITQASTPFTLADDDAKIIAPGLWSSYVQYSSEYVANIERIGFDGNYVKAYNGELPVEINRGGIVNLADQDLTAVRFTNFDAIATTTYPLTGDEIDVNFLNPVITESTGQWCEFLIGVTEYKPALVEVTDDQENVTQEIRFIQKDGVTQVEPSLDDLLYEEFTHSGILRDRDGYEQGEGDYPLGTKMDMDYRLPRPAGDDSGVCSSVRFTVDPRINFETTYSATNPLTQQPGNYLIFSSRPSTLIGSFKLTGGEFGIGDTAASATSSGIRFQSEVTQYTVDEILGTLGYFVEISDVPAESNINLWLSPVTVQDRNQLSAGGDKNFSKTRIFSFELKPLYLVIRLRDKARVNNITITESINDVSNSFCPDWIVNSGVSVVTSGGSQTGAPAANYKSKDRLESSSIDTSVKQPLRPYKVKDTIYVAPNTREELSLEGIYGPDRTTITPGLLNTTATFLVGRSLKNNDLNIISLNVNTKEQ